MEFRCNGIDELTDSLGKLAFLPDDDKWEIISAMAEVVKAKQVEVFQRLFRQPTGQLAASIEVRKKNGDGGIYALVGPNALPHKRLGGGKTKARTNAEIAYVLEYGNKKIRARHWMETANKEAHESMIAAGQEAYNRILARMGLIEGG